MPTLDDAIDAFEATPDGPAGGPPRADSLDTALEDTAAQANAQRRMNLYGAVRQDADQYGQAVQMSRATGVPAPVVSRNLADVKRRLQLDAIDATVEGNSALGRELEKPDFANLAHDDVENLKALEAAVGAASAPGWRPLPPLEPTFGSYVSGLWNSLVQGSQQAKLGLQMQAADVLGSDSIDSQVRRADLQRKYEQASARLQAGTPGFASSTSEGIYGGLSSVLQQAPGLALSILSRSPAPALASAGLQTEAQAYGKYRARGASPGEALAGAVGEGGVEVATELLPMGFLVQRFGKDGAKAFLGGLLARELPTEQVATLVQDALDTAIANPDKTWGEYLAERPEAAYQTALATLVQSGVMTGAHVGVDRLLRTQDGAGAAVQDAAVLEQVRQLAAASKVRPRDAQSFEDFVASAGTDGPVQDVYLDAQTLNQSGIDPAALAALSPSAAAQMAEALATGGDLVIPVSEYAARVAGTDLDTALAPHLRTSEEGLSLDEAQRFYQSQGAELQAAAAQVMEEKAADDAWTASVKDVESQLFEQMKSAGRFTDDVNTAYTTLMRDFYVTTASRLGITPSEMLARYPLQVRAESVAGEQRMDQGVTQTEQTDELTGLPLNSDGTVTVWHHTNAANAEEIRKSGTLKSRGEPDVYVTTRQETDTGYGDTAVPIRVKPELLQIDDEFPDGRVDYRINVKRPGGSLPVQVGVAKAKDPGVAGEQRMDQAGPFDLSLPADSNQLREVKIGNTTIVLDANANTGQVKVSSVRTPRTKRGQGSARVAMQALVDQADAQGVALWLDASALDKKTSTAKLVDFYKSLGFEPTGRTVNALGEPEMVRQPDAAKAKDLSYADTSPAQAATGQPWTGMVLRGETGGAAEAGATDAGDYGKGRYFTGDRERANAYARGPIDQPDRGGTVISERVTLRNPLVFKTGRDAREYRRSVVGDALLDKPQSEEAAQRIDADLRAKGHDGVVVYDSEGHYTATPDLPFEVVQLGDGGQQLPLDLDQFFPGKSAAMPAGTPPATLEVDGQTRPTTNANGQPLAQTEEGVRNFWRWFGDSKVVDEKGQPLVVYHGTGQRFNQFKHVQEREPGDYGAGFYLTGDKALAQGYAEQRAGKAGEPVVMPLYASVKNPFVVNLDSNLTEAQQKFPPIRDKEQAARFTESLAAQGYDGVIVKLRDVDDVTGQIDAEWLEEVVAFDPAQIKSAIGNRGTFDPSDRNILNQSAGPRAATADTHALSQAQARLASGEDAEAVRQQTGWFQGPDGKWRYEISDDDARVTLDNLPPEAAQALEAGEAAVIPLGRLLEHPRLFAAYPQLAELPVKVVPGQKEASYTPARAGGPTIEIGYRKGTVDPSVLLHEIQHGLQDIEGFAVGGDPAALRQAMQTRPYDDVTNLLAVVEHLTGETAYFEPSRLRDVEDPGEFVQQYLDAIPPATLDREVTAEEAPLLEGMGLTFDAAEGYPGWGSVLEQLADDARRDIEAGQTGLSPEEQYRRLAGEVEARNTEARQRMTDEQRRVTAPSATADVADTDVIVVFNGAEMASVPLPANASGVPQPGAAQTETAAFKAWFGDSKVVDADGKPLVVYHGTRHDFSEFQREGLRGQKVHYFAEDPGVANEYAGEVRYGSPNVMPAYVSLQAPYQFDAGGALWGSLPLSIFPAELTQHFDERNILRGRAGSEPRIGFTDVIRSALKAGYDGVIADNIVDGGGPYGDKNPTKVVVASRPEQIKSAIGNRGTFDPSDPSILNQGGGGNRAEISFAKDIASQPSVITLFKNADLSSFLHEMGHFQLEVLAHIASRPNAPQAIVDDMNAALEWFKSGLSIEQWNAMSLEEKRPYHEQFARGFEAYLFEGKAPNAELTSLFQRFRAWLLAVYKSVKALNVDISPEIRGVFDRLLASDATIQAAETARSMAPLFTSPEAMGDTPQAWADYQRLGLEATRDAQDELAARGVKDLQWLTRARGRILKQLQKDAKAKREAVEAEVRAELETQPVYAVQRFLKSGELDEADRNNAQRKILRQLAGHPVKLSLPILKKLYGDGPAAPWRYLSTGKSGLAASEGVHPDLVAELFGYASGDQLVRELLAAEPFNEAVEGLTDQRVLERYGDLAHPDTLARAADEAIHNEARARFVATELKALTKAQGPVRATQQAAKAFAETLIARKQVKAIKPNQHASAEARAAKQAEQALKAGDLPRAAHEKRNQLVQNYATRAAYDALAEIEKAVKYLRKFDRENARIDPEYREQIEALLERFDLRKSVSNKDASKRQSLLKWVESQREQGFEPDVPEALLAEAQRQPYRELTLEELRGLVDTVKQIEHLGRLKNKLLTAQDERAFEAVTEEISASITEHAHGRSAETRTPTDALGKLAKTLKRFWASHIKAATWSRVMDGGEDGGPMWEYFIRSANVRGDQETQMRADATLALSKILTPVVETWPTLQGKGRYFESVGRAFTREGALALALNTGNAGNLQRLLGGEGWTLEQIRPVLESLTAQEWQAVQAIWDHFETYRPAIGAKEKRIYGKEPNWVEPTPFSVRSADGTEVQLKGGYYPIKYDAAASQRAEEHADADQAKRDMQGAYTAATTRRSFTKARVEEVSGRPLLYSLVGIYSGVNDVIHDLSWHEWLIDANRLLRNQDIDQAIRSHYGPEVKDQFKQWVKDVAQGESRADHPAEVGVAWLRQSVSAAGLGFNVMSAIMQVTGFTQSLVRVGPTYMGRGIAQAAAHPIAIAREVVGKSTFMADRSRTQFRELNELRNQVEGQTVAGRYLTLGTYFLMMRMQKLVDVPTWLGAYEKAIAGGNNEDRSIALADQAVIDAQGSGMVKDLSTIERGGPVLKLFTVFYSYMNTALNLGTATAMTERNKAKLAAKFLMLYTAPVVLGYALKNALTPGGDDEPEDIARDLIAEQLSFLTGLFVGVREFGEVGKIVAGTEGLRGYAGPAGTRTVGDALKAAEQATQGEFDSAFARAAINLLGDVSGLPSAQINRTLGGIQALSEGQTSNPAALVLGYQR